MKEVIKSKSKKFNTTNSFRVYIKEILNKLKEKAKPNLEQIFFYRKNLNPKFLSNYYSTLKNYFLYNTTKRTVIEK